MADAGVIAGMAAAAGAAACFDGAVILQAAEARRVDERHGLRFSLLRRLATRRRWVAGTGIAILGWPLQLLALSLAPLTVVQPTLALGLVLLLVAGARVLGERVGRREWIAALTVIAGVALLGAGAPEHTAAVPPAAATLVALLVLGVAAAAPFAAGRERVGAWALIGGAGCAFALAAVTSKLLTIELDHGRPLAALGWAAAAAAAAGTGFLVDMTAMQRFAATRVAPPMFVLETALPVVLAPLLFAERWGVAVVVGLVLVLGGGAVLGPAASAAGDAEHEVGGSGQGAVAEVGLGR